MCYYLNTHTLQIVIAGLHRSGDLNMHSSFASSALAFVLGAEEPHKAFRHQRHGPTKIANCKILTAVLREAAGAPHTRTMQISNAAFISAPLEHSFLLIWPSACFTPGWLNVPLGLEMSAGVGGEG